MFVSIITVAAATAGLAAPLARPAAAATEPTFATGENFGIQNGEIWSWDVNQANAVIAGMAATGAKWVRLGLSWDSIEPTWSGGAHTYHFDHPADGSTNRLWFDGAVRSALDHGMKVLLTFNFTASWAADPSCKETTTDDQGVVHPAPTNCPPAPDATTQAAWHAFVKTSVQRYKNFTLTDGSTGHVTAFEFYNEPNHFSHWQGTTTDASNDGAIYAEQILHEASKAVREVTPPSGSSWTIVTAGLDTHIAQDQADFQSVPTFMDQMGFVNIALDGSNIWYDALGIHPYQYFNEPLSSGHGFTRAQELFDHANAIGMAKPEWATEFGLCTASTITPQCGDYDAYANLLPQYMAAWQSKAYSGPAFRYQYMDCAACNGAVEQSWGLVHTDGSPKLTTNNVKLSDVYLLMNSVALPTVSVGNFTVGEGNTGDPIMKFSATLSSPLGSQTTAYVAWSTTDGTAHAGTDYVAPTGLQTLLVFPPGATTATGQVQIKSNTADDGNRTFKVNLVNSNAAVRISAAGDMATTTIVDDDPTAPAVKIGNAAGFEGNSGSRNFVFNINLPAPVCSTCTAVTYHVLTQDGTATAGSDYSAVDTTVTFNPGDIVETVSVPVTGDSNVETNETFTVRVRNVGSTTNLASGTGTIKNDD